MAPLGTAELAGLRRRIAGLEQGSASAEAKAEILPFGISALDAALGGGLAWAALHEASAAAPGTEGTLTAFGLSLAAMAARARRRPILVVQQERAALEAGRLYAPGLTEAGLPDGTMILVRVRKADEALLVMEEALKCPGLSAVLGDIASPLPEALTATRRLSLAARAGGTLGLLLRPAPDGAPCAAVTRWVIGPAPAAPADAHGGLGIACLAVRLARNRHGPPGAWTLALCAQGFALPGSISHEQPDGHDTTRGAPLSQPVARSSLHGPHRAGLAG